MVDVMARLWSPEGRGDIRLRVSVDRGTTGLTHVHNSGNRSGDALPDSSLASGERSGPRRELLTRVVGEPLEQERVHTSADDAANERHGLAETGQ